MVFRREVSPKRITSKMFTQNKVICTRKATVRKIDVYANQKKTRVLGSNFNLQITCIGMCGYVLIQHNLNLSQKDLTKCKINNTFNHNWINKNTKSEVGLVKWRKRKIYGGTNVRAHFFIRRNTVLSQMKTIQ